VPALRGRAYITRSVEWGVGAAADVLSLKEAAAAEAEVTAADDDDDDDDDDDAWGPLVDPCGATAPPECL
jgi:hypothetical protein